jgi:PIN domain nuclease of toxin-antitoxin system
VVRALLDTHALLWWILEDPALSQGARGFIKEANNMLLVSAASAWEMAIKFQAGKLPRAAELVARFVSEVELEGFQLLSITAEHGIRAGLLPGPHKDPFDRLLIAQSQAENVPIISNEAVFDAYGVRRLW